MKDVVVIGGGVNGLVAGRVAGAAQAIDADSRAARRAGRRRDDRGAGAGIQGAHAQPLARAGQPRGHPRLPSRSRGPRVHHAGAVAHHTRPRPPVHRLSSRRGADRRIDSRDLGEGRRPVERLPAIDAADRRVPRHPAPSSAPAARRDSEARALALAHDRPARPRARTTGSRATHALDPDADRRSHRRMVRERPAPGGDCRSCDLRQPRGAAIGWHRRHVAAAVGGRPLPGRQRRHGAWRAGRARRCARQRGEEGRRGSENRGARRSYHHPTRPRHRRRARDGRRDCRTRRPLRDRSAARLRRSRRSDRSAGVVRGANAPLSRPRRHREDQPGAVEPALSSRPSAPTTCRCAVAS